VRSVDFAKVSVNGVSGSELRISYFKLRRKCFLKMSLSSEIALIEATYDKVCTYYIAFSLYMYYKVFHWLVISAGNCQVSRVGSDNCSFQVFKNKTNQVKAIPTGYMMFMTEKSKKLLQKNPHMKQVDRVKAVAAKWNKLDPEKKKVSAWLLARFSEYAD